jgi:hypothetical protein
MLYKYKHAVPEFLLLCVGGDLWRYLIKIVSKTQLRTNCLLQRSVYYKIFNASEWMLKFELFVFLGLFSVRLLLLSLSLALFLQLRKHFINQVNNH